MPAGSVSSRQQHISGPASEYGILPDRGVVQILGTYYF
jgi:hypothetical protein